MILQVLKESVRTVIVVSQAEIVEGLKEIATSGGFLISPGGPASWKALLHLCSNKQIQLSEKVVLLYTGKGYKYPDDLMEA